MRRSCAPAACRTARDVCLMKERNALPETPRRRRTSRTVRWPTESSWPVVNQRPPPGPVSWPMQCSKTFCSSRNTSRIWIGTRKTEPMLGKRTSVSPSIGQDGGTMVPTFVVAGQKPWSVADRWYWLYSTRWGSLGRSRRAALPSRRVPGVRLTNLHLETSLGRNLQAAWAIWGCAQAVSSLKAVWWRRQLCRMPTSRLPRARRAWCGAKLGCSDVAS